MQPHRPVPRESARSAVRLHQESFLFPQIENLYRRLPLTMPDITELLNAVEQGNAQASDELLPLVYDELRRLANIKLNRESPGQTLQATALVHEAYLRLVTGSADVQWNNRRHFFSAAAESMRRILVDRARQKRTEKHGGGLNRVELGDEALAHEHRDSEIVALDEALDRLAERDQIKAELVKLRFFAGLTNKQAAKALAIGEATADRYWAYARAWLRAEISGLPKP
jgi:RNA polymerase sigma factor (TIGR02999 family)